MWRLKVVHTCQGMYRQSYVKPGREVSFSDVRKVPHMLATTFGALAQVGTSYINVGKLETVDSFYLDLGG